MRPAETTDAWHRAQRRRARSRDPRRLRHAAPGGAGDRAGPARGAGDTDGRTAALVTPDRDLARRVAAELRRWDIEIDDSAGQPLADTPPATLLRACSPPSTRGFAPVDLLALLKHPLARSACRAPPCSMRRAGSIANACAA